MAPVNKRSKGLECSHGVANSGSTKVCECLNYTVKAVFCGMKLETVAELLMYPAHGTQHTFNDAKGFAEKYIIEKMLDAKSKLDNADDETDKCSGGNQPVILESLQAAILVRAHMSMHQALQHSVAEAGVLSKLIKTRDEMISSYARLCKFYADQFEELILFNKAKKLMVYNRTHAVAKTDGVNNLESISTMNEYLVAKIEELEASLELSNTMNRCLKIHIDAIPMPDLDKPMRSLQISQIDWKSFEKEVERQKQGILTALNKSEMIQVSCQRMNTTQANDFFRKLANHIIETSGLAMLLELGEDFWNRTWVLPSSIDASVSNFSEIDISTCTEKQVKELVDCFNMRIPPVDVGRILESTAHAQVIPTDLTAEIDLLRFQLLHAQQERDAAQDEARKWIMIKNELLGETRSWRNVSCAQVNLWNQCEARSEEFTKLARKFLKDTVENFPDIAVEFGKFPEVISEVHLNFILKAICDLKQEHTKTLHSNDLLSKRLTSKDRELKKMLIDKQKDTDFANQVTQKRYDALEEDRCKLESKLEAAKRELAAALKEPAKVKEEWSSKIQRLHDKVAARDSKLKEHIEVHEILKLDHVATLQELNTMKREVAELQKCFDSQKQEVREVQDLKKQTEGLKKSLVVAKTSQRMEADKIKQAVRKATESANARIAVLERENEVRLSSNKELSLTNALRMDKINGLEKALSDMEEVQNATLDELERVRRDRNLRRGSDNQEPRESLEKELAEERAKSSQLEAMLAPFLSEAASLSSVQKSL